MENAKMTAHQAAKERIAYAQDLTDRMRKAARHERLAILREAACVGMRFTVIAGLAQAVES